MKKKYEKIVLDILFLSETDVLKESDFTQGDNELPLAEINGIFQ